MCNYTIPIVHWGCGHTQTFPHRSVLALCVRAKAQRLKRPDLKGWTAICAVPMIRYHSIASSPSPGTCPCCSYYAALLEWDRYADLASDEDERARARPPFLIPCLDAPKGGPPAVIGYMRAAAGKMHPLTRIRAWVEDLARFIWTEERIDSDEAIIPTQGWLDETRPARVERGGHRYSHIEGGR